MTKSKAYSQEELNKILWDAANSSRSAVDGSIYKDYALAMLFFKYISDKSKKQLEGYQKRFGKNKQRIEQKMKADRFYLPPKTTFDYIHAIIEEDNIGEEINKVLHAIEDHNKEKLEGVFSAIDFNSEATLGKLDQRNKMIRHLIGDFAKIDLRDVKEDIIGDAYMFMLERFGTEAGKKAGEFFTRQSVASLVAKLAEPKKGDRICDPACGSGGLLLLAGEEVEEQGSKNYALYGQESTGSTFQLSRMNMFLHGRDQAHLEWGDTLNSPLLLENDKLMKFDTLVCNPPFSLRKWGAENAESDRHKRFWRGVPPKDKGDFAFIAHMVETAKPKKGRIAVIVPHGVLFRGGAEGKIREAFLRENIIDAVIGLPANLFQTTGIPVAILVIDRSREKSGKNERKKNILFIEASKQFKSGKAQNHLEEEHINRIYSTYKKRKKVEKFAHVAKFSEIEENDFNLNITRYVDTFEEEEPIDIKANLKELKKLNPEIQKLEKEMDKYLKKLNIK